MRITSSGAPVAEIILGYAVQSGSDLLVAAAYSHARLPELLLVGASRTLLTEMPDPVRLPR